MSSLKHHDRCLQQMYNCHDEYSLTAPLNYKNYNVDQLISTQTDNNILGLFFFFILCPALVQFRKPGSDQSNFASFKWLSFLLVTAEL